MKAVSEVVFANSAKEKSDWGAIPEVGREALTSAEAGKYIPKMVVLSADGSERIAVLAYKEMNKDGFREVKKRVKAHLSGGSTLPATDEVPASLSQASGERLVENWTNTEGKTIKACFVSEADGQVSFTMENGSTVSYELAKLAVESQERIKKRKAEAK